MNHKMFNMNHTYYWSHTFMCEIYYIPMPYFLLLFFYFLPFSCRFFENEFFFTINLLRVHAFFVEILKMNGKKGMGLYNTMYKWDIFPNLFFTFLALLGMHTKITATQLVFIGLKAFLGVVTLLSKLLHYFWKRMFTKEINVTKMLIKYS